ncbi:MAG: ankyrin repeat domain-containing protein [Flavobacteriales bacterium]|nr:hypothetical protein [Flavobacteriales bacterium]MCC6575840.1 ankyrin repeat domain-containing protein [Flavobacteriales bacterium]NUQ13853.1 ankyrin repeat domain-containing protein [Flavobacteriales bacterium]
MLGLASFRAQRQLTGEAKPPRLPLDLVQEFVRAGHGELDTVQRLLKEHPGLLNTSHDWGGGDFETALEGAGHVGDRAVAEYLIGQGARANIFVLTMLGRTVEVKALLAAFPNLLRSKGPHGLTLLHHAQRGGGPAMPLLDHLMALGLSEVRLPMP